MNESFDIIFIIVGLFLCVSGLFGMFILTKTNFFVQDKITSINEQIDVLVEENENVEIPIEEEKVVFENKPLDSQVETKQEIETQIEVPSTYNINFGTLPTAFMTVSIVLIALVFFYKMTKLVGSYLIAFLTITHENE